MSCHLCKAMNEKKAGKLNGRCPQCMRFWVDGEAVPSWDERITWWRFTKKAFKRVTERFGPFDLEVGGNQEDHFLDRYVGPGGLLVDALGEEPWPAFERAYSHPPAGLERQFVMRAQEEVNRQGEGVVVLLCAANTQPRSGKHLQLEIDDGHGNIRKRKPYVAVFVEPR